MLHPFLMWVWLIDLVSPHKLFYAAVRGVPKEVKRSIPSGVSSRWTETESALTEAWQVAVTAGGSDVE